MHAFLKIIRTSIFFFTHVIFNFILQYTNSLLLSPDNALCMLTEQVFVLSLSSSLSPPSLYVRSVCVLIYLGMILYIYIITTLFYSPHKHIGYHTCRIILYYTNEVLTSTKFNHVDTIQPMALLYKI